MAKRNPDTWTQGENQAAVLRKVQSRMHMLVTQAAASDRRKTCGNNNWEELKTLLPFNFIPGVGL